MDLGPEGWDRQQARRLRICKDCVATLLGGVEGCGMDEDLEKLDREQVVAEVKRLRAGIRAHRDSSGHDLCWHHLQLWSLVPEPISPEIAVPPWPRFLRG